MTLIREKSFKVAGFSFKIGTEAMRVERLKRSLPYRYLVRPAVAALSRGQNGNGRGASASAPPAPVAAQVANGAGSADASEEAARVANIGWYHTIDLGNGIVTPGFIDNRDTVHRFGLPDDLTGKRCLDIGTYDGFWAFEMEKRGASEVIGIDVDSPLDHDMPLPARRKAMEHLGENVDWRDVWSAQQAERGLQYPGDGFRLAAEILGSSARRENLNVYDLSPEKVGKFDVVLISQLLLRLRDPQTVIENMFSVTNEGGFALIAEPFDTDLEALDRPVSEFLGTSLMGIWWRHSAKSMAKMMETAGFSPVEEVSRFQAANREGAFSKVVLKGYVPVGSYEGEKRESP